MAKIPQLPTREELLEFIKASPTKISKREIAKAFNLKGDKRVWLKDMLRTLATEGLIERGRKRHVGSHDQLPPVAVCTVSAELSKDGEVLLKADGEDSHSPIIFPDKKAASLNPGDQGLFRLKWDGVQKIYVARLLKRLKNSTETVVGIVNKSARSIHLQVVERRHERTFTILNPPADLADGELVMAEVSQGAGGRTSVAKIKKRLGQSKDATTISLISIHAHDIPNVFPKEVIREADEAATLPPLGKRDDLRHIPLVTIDGEDARDFDDAVWARNTEDNGWHLIVAIADVSHYVRPGTPLDQEAYKRGNSVYFPDRVVPMLPESLSNGMCSLKPDEDRACMAVHMWLDAKGRLKKYKFVRALMRSSARLTYTQVQKAIDGVFDSKTEPLWADVIQPLYKAFQELKIARDIRGTLDLDISEQKILFGPDGHISEIKPAPRMEANMLIEEFMILANVAAAQQLEQRNAPCMYRIHETPSEDRILGFREAVKGLGFSFPKGQAIRPKSFSQILNAAKGTPNHSLVSELALRSQMQARYDSENVGHFGLNLARYAHFTSPIRRYSDLVVHRSLISSLSLGSDGLSGDEDLAEVASHLSTTERRADTAEREARERYITTYLMDKIGDTFEGRVRGVMSFGLFVELNDIGIDGLVPLSMLPDDFYVHNEKLHQLVGRKTKKTYMLGDEISVQLVEVNTLANSITLAAHGKTVPKGKPTSNFSKSPKSNGGKKPLRKPGKK